eukprot:TCONS_00025395-protein
MQNQHAEPWNAGFDQASQNSHTLRQQGLPPQTDASRLPSQNREEFERFQRSKDRTFLCMLILVIVFLLGSIVCGGVAVAMVPWWKHSREAPEVSEWIHIGFWEACFKPEPDQDWECNKYTNSDTLQSPDSLGMDILISLSLAGIGVAFLALILTIVASIFKKSRYIRELLFSICVLCLIGAGLLGSVIGLVLDKDKAENLIPRGIQIKSTVTGIATLKHALMFFIMCGAGGAVFMALVFTAVILFIHDDVDLNDMKYDNDEDLNLEMDEDGFPVKEKRQENDQPGPSSRYLDVPDIGMIGDGRHHEGGGGRHHSGGGGRHHNGERRQKRTSQGSYDAQYSNPSFHPQFNMGYDHHYQHPRHPHRPSSHASHGRPSSYYSDSSRNGHRPTKPPRANRSRDPRMGGGRPGSGDFRSYEDYEMYFNTPY